MLPRVVPPDHPGQPAEVLVLAGRTVRASPPATVQWCMPPDSHKAHLDCCMPASTCQGDSNKCADCYHTFCAHHLTAHAKRIQLPRKYWKAITQGILQDLDALAKGTKKRTRTKPVLNAARRALDDERPQGGS